MPQSECSEYWMQARATAARVPTNGLIHAARGIGWSCSLFLPYRTVEPCQSSWVLPGTQGSLSLIRNPFSIRSHSSGWRDLLFANCCLVFDLSAAKQGIETHWYSPSLTFACPWSSPLLGIANSVSPRECWLRKQAGGTLCTVVNGTRGAAPVA